MIARIHDGAISPLTNSLLGNTPVGTIIGWRGTAAPNGYLPCTGQQYDTSLYKDLYSVLKSSTLPVSYDTSVVNYDAATNMTLSSTATVMSTSGILYINYFHTAMTLTVNGVAVHMQSNNAQSKSWFYPVSAGDSVVTNNSITVMFAPYKYFNYIKATMLAAAAYGGGTQQWSSEDTQIGTMDGATVYRKVLTFSLSIPASTWTSIGNGSGRILSCCVVDSNGSYPVACRMNNNAIEVWSPLSITATGAVIERVEEQ